MKWPEKNLSKKFHLFLFLKFLFILEIIIPSLSSSYQCDSYAPFLFQNESCVTSYGCPIEYLASGICEISNETVKIQYFNNMLYLNFTDAKLTNFDIHTTPNGNLIFLGSSPESEYKDKRVFYVLNKNGRGYFTDQITNEENAISIFEDLSSSINYGNLFSIRIDNKEYIWIISENSKIEIYDLDAHLKYEYNASQIFESYSYNICLHV